VPYYEIAARCQEENELNAKSEGSAQHMVEGNVDSPDSLDSACPLDTHVSCRRHLNDIKDCEARHFRELPQHVYMARVTISISDVSVRWTGHLFAISSSLDRCSAVNEPVKCMSRSIRSSIPSLVSQSAQSEAWILECRRRTVTSLSGQPFRRAYIPTVIEVQDPNAASRKS
jgi:hypothetical protein